MATQQPQVVEPWTDEIVSEVRAARERLLASCDYDLKKLASRLRDQEAARGAKSVSFPKRSPTEEEAA